MRLTTFRAPDGSTEVGAVVDQSVVSLTRAMPRTAPDMPTLIAAWPEIERVAERHVAGAVHRFALSEVRLLAPVQRPGKIMAIGLNYADHVAETGQPRPAQQIWSTKAVTAINGPFDPIEISADGPFVDYEAELVVVVGTGGRRLSPEAARSAVFGYCVGNDVTERAWQTRTDQWTLGKSFDTHAPIGPWITTADEVPDPHSLRIHCAVNGETRQESSTGELIFDVWTQVSYLSTVMTLEPGDLIFTGTPSGIGAALDPIRFLGDGDQVRIEIAGLGAIHNPCAMPTIEADHAPQLP